NDKNLTLFKSLADKNPINLTDRVIDSRLEVLDLISSKTYVKGIEINEDIAWLLGAFAGDGNDQLIGNVISFYSSDNNFTQKILKIIKQYIPHSSISLNNKPGCVMIAVYGFAAKLFIESAFEVQ